MHRQWEDVRWEQSRDLWEMSHRGFICDFIKGLINSMATSAAAEHIIVAGMLPRGYLISLSFVSIFEKPVVKYSVSEIRLYTWIYVKFAIYWNSLYLPIS